MIMHGNSRGFTLIELIVAMGISGIVMTAVYTTYQSQQKSYAAQQEVAAMQQKLRTAMYFMTRQIREAGCNPAGINTSSSPRIITANVDEIEFTADTRGSAFGSPPNGNTNDSYEHVTYSLYSSDGIQKLGVKSTATEAQFQPVIEYVDALNFVYLDGSGNVTGLINNIRSVEVTLVVRAERPDRNYVNNTVYKNNQSDVVLPAQNDHYRRRAATVQIKCRNLGL
jgi:type IV pilus assembly protein PilW